MSTTVQRGAGATIARGLLAEFEQELGTTHRFLERIPAEKLKWRPHAKSMSAGQLALHVAQVPRGVLRMALTDESAPPDLSSPRPEAASMREVFDALAQSAAFVRETLPTLDDARMASTFAIVAGGKTVMS